jgi:S1-C subfamily serine protease
VGRSGLVYAVIVTPHRNRRRGYTATLAVAAGIILVVGWLAQPENVPDSPDVLPTPTELEQLARRAQRRSLESTVDYFAGVARDVGGSLVQLRDLAASGVVWETRFMVTAALAHPYAENPSSVGVTGSDVTLQRRLWGPDLPITVLQTDRDPLKLTPMRRSTSPLEPGAWVVAVWRTEEGRPFAVGNYLQTQSATCNTTRIEEVLSTQPLTSAMRGGGLFDIDGGLLGIVVPCGERFATVSTATVDRLLQREHGLGRRLLVKYGIVLALPTVEERALFDQAPGLILRELWIASPAEVAGLHAGDLVIEVNGSPVESLADVEPHLLTSHAPAILHVRRGRRTVNVRLGDAGATVEQQTAPAVAWQRPAAEGYRIQSVVPGTAAASAGLEAGDRIVTIDHSTPRNADELQRLFSGETKRPLALLEVERQGRRVAIILRRGSSS